MTLNEYKLVRLQVQFYDLYPYDFDPEYVSIDDFTDIKAIKNNLDSYCENYDEQDMTEDEVKLIKDIYELLEEIKEDREEE
jgi:hypothetical protein